MASAQEGGEITGENSCTLQQRSSSMSVGRFSSHDRQTPSSNNEVDARKEKRRRSWLDIIKLKGRKKSKKSVLSKSMSEAKLQEDKNPPVRDGGDNVQVIVTDLCPEIYYKTLPITRYTTTFEVIVKLVQKFATKEADKDPNSFYLTEVKENDQGSYSRVLKNNDQLMKIQSKWNPDSKCCFALCRAHNVVTGSLVWEEGKKIQDEEQDGEQTPITPLRAMIISPSQDSFYSGLSDQDNYVFQPSINIPPVSSHEPKDYLPDTVQTNNGFQGLSSRIRSSKLINPSDKSEGQDSSQLPTSVNVKKKPSKHTAKALSESNIVTFVEREDGNSSDPILNKQKKMAKREFMEARGGLKRVKQRELMQQSINQGMHGIMTKVISETKHNSSSPSSRNSHQRSQTVPSAFHFESDNVVVRPLMCSPQIPNEVKKYPNFVFTPFQHDSYRGTKREDLVTDRTHNGNIDFGRKNEEFAAENLNSRFTLREMEEKMKEGLPRNQFHEKMTHISSTNGVMAKEPREANILDTSTENLQDHEKSLVRSDSKTLKDNSPKLSYKTEMDLVTPLSSLLSRKLNNSATNRSLKHSDSFSSGTTLNVNKGETSPGMKRSKTDMHVGRTSVTKLKRPHSFHVSKSTNNATTKDFTKDEFIRKAALKGMVRKPCSKDTNDQPHAQHERRVLLEPREVVTDLDRLVFQRQAIQKRYSKKSFHL